MRRLAFVEVIVAIALSSCQAGLKNQVLGKWQMIIEENKQVCIDEYLEKYMTTTCTLGQEKLFTVTSSYEIDGGDRIVFTSSKGVKDVIRTKVNGDEMEQKLSNGNIVKLTRVK